MACCVFLLAALIVASVECANTDVIRLDLSKLRGRSPSLPWMYPGGTPPEPPSQKPAIFCTDSVFPNDLSCDLRTLYMSDIWKNRMAPDIYDAAIEYRHPQVRGVTCEARFLKAEGQENPLRLSYGGIDCEPRASGPRVPPFRVAEASQMSIVVRKPDDYFFSCKFEFKNQGKKMKSAARGGFSSVIKFEYDNLSCVSPIAIGRMESKKDCVNDGRRCRPVKK